MKGYKVASYNLTKRFGICASNLQELIRRGCLKLQIPSEEGVQVLLLDGTEVEDEEYFQALPAQTLFIFAQPGQVPLAGSFFLIDCLRKVHKSFADAADQARELLSDPRVMKKMSAALGSLDRHHQCMASSKKEDPDWFLNLDTGCQTKEAFLSRRAKERMRNYWWKTKEQALREAKTSGERCKIESILDSFRQRLVRLGYNGHYFDRSSKLPGRLCSAVGDFQCEGEWSQSSCIYQEDFNHNSEQIHLVNPYVSRERRILFSTWNLDHVVERSRTVIPSLMEAVRGSHQRAINTDYFFDLIFTRRNLRLVHPICHDKRGHQGKACNPILYYLPLKENKKRRI